MTFVRRESMDLAQRAGRNVPSLTTVLELIEVLGADSSAEVLRLKFGDRPLEFGAHCALQIVKLCMKFVCMRRGNCHLSVRKTISQ